MIHRKTNLALLSLALLVGLRAGVCQQSTSEPASRADASSTPPKVRLPSNVTAGLLLTKVAPIYPKSARKKHIEGTVIMQAIITKDGDIANLQLVSGDPVLAEAALDAVKRWRYRPYLKDGEPVEVDTTIQVNFRLSK